MVRGLLAIQDDVGWNRAVPDGREGILRDLVVLVVDLADPADACGRHQVRRDCVAVVQQEDAAQGRLKLLTVERVGSDDQWGLSKDGC